MAERRRRRSTECESETEHAEPVLSEYESTADDSRDVDETEEDTDTEEYVTEEEETAEEEEDEDKDKSGVVDGERQSGDGEEQPKLDIDEDRQNPAYIPKRGAFYEHDMRLDPEEEGKEGGDQQREEGRGKGKLWKDESKWLHDRFEQYDQAPKSRQELITMYGYDITQYDQPPEEPPKMSGRSRRGGRRDRKPQFQDFLPDGDKGRPNYRSNRERYDDDSYDDRGPRQSKSETPPYRGGRGRRGQRRSEGGAPRRGYSDVKEDRAPRNRGFSDRGRDSRDGDFRNRDNFGNRDRDSYGNRDRDDYRNKDNYGNRDHDNFGKRDRDNYGNRDRDNYGNRDRDNYGNRDRDSHGNRDRDQDNYGNRDRDNYRNRGQYDESSQGRGKRDYQDRSEGRGGFRGRGRGGFKDNRRENRRDFGNRDNVDQQSGGRSNREHANYERQYSGGRDGQNYERQNSGGRDGENQFRRQGGNRQSRTEPDSPQQENTRYRGGELTERPPARSFDKPTPKSYYTLSVTDDEKLGEMEDVEYSPPAKGGVQDLNVTVTGERRSFNKDRPRPPRSQDYVQQSSVEERRDGGPSHGTSGQNKHQPTLPPRLQQQQQQQERKRQKQQQQQVMGDKQDATQSRSNKRYSSQRQRAVPEGPGYSEPQISQPPQQIVTSPLQQQFQPNFSPPKPAGAVQQSVIVRPTIATQMTAPPQQQTVGSPTLVIPRVPPPQSMIPVSSQVPPPQVRLQRPPPPAGPSPQGIGAPPPVFPSGSLPTSAMPAVSVIAAPLINPAGIVYAAPPPAYQVPVPQFSASPESHNPGETVRGGTTYYSQATAGNAASPGTTYYSPEMQVAKQNRVQVRRPKVPLPIVNPEDMKKETDSSKEVEDDNVDTYQEVSESYEEEEVKQEQDDFDESFVSTEADGQESRLAADLEQIEEHQEAVTEEVNETQEPKNLESELNLSGSIPGEINDTRESKSELNDEEQYSFESDEPGFNETAGNDGEMTSGVDLESVVETSFGSVKSSEDVVKTEEHSVSAEERLADSAEQPTENTESLDTTSMQSNVEDNNRSSTFVVKTDVLTPTLSVSTVIPDTSDKEQTETSKPDTKTEVEQVTSDVSAMDSKVEDSTGTDGNVEVDAVLEKQSKEADENVESFEDAIEEVN
ncbi:protein CASC3-like [Mercenaria mercenaria]|uniref:protein CASC3-like n=1 Tax=Mercenaria mercenaria TaxID=6596 RepID=UPI00234E82F7|nr:protein CASC3-like [Mercenaria mercenaria]